MAPARLVAGRIPAAPARTCEPMVGRRIALFVTLLVLPLAPGRGIGAPSISIEFWTISLQPFFTDYINGMVAAYERAHPGVRIRWVDVQFGAIEQKLLAALAGGVAPDVVNLNTEMTVRLAERSALVDMDAAVPAAARGRYFDGLWRSTQVRGRTYGIPWYVVPNVIAYNTALYRRAGLNPSQPPQTEEEMIQHARTIKDRARVYGFMPNVDGVRMLHRFQENGLPVLSPDGKRAVFNSPAHVEYLSRYVDLFRQDYFPEDTLRRGYLGATERYSAGQLGMLITGPQFLLRVKRDNPEVYAQTFVAPYPRGKGNTLHLATMTVAVPRASRNTEAAVDFALFVTNDENQLAFSRQVVVFPSTRQAASDPFFRQGGAAPEDVARKVAAADLPYARDLSVIVPHAGDLFRVFREAVESAFYGKRTPREALDWAVAQWNARL
ncbi:MAG: sugar ABC transporter substrate-binding protein [Armatimonadota bacterium]|nr:sugar ABC transporter substrate-binding protein [Armatimonadota bacterium]